MLQNRVIILNGPSSVGKTSIARVLQDTLSGEFHYMPWDAFLQMCPRGRTGPKLKFAFVEAAQSMLRHEHNLILDVVCPKPFMDTMQTSLKDYEPFLVGVKARLEVIQERLKQRPDRNPKLAEQQLHLHDGIQYDVEVDTSDQDKESATAIIVAKFQALAP